MTQNCWICGAHLDLPVYVSTNHNSLTTMLSACEGKTEVFFCDTCGHLQTQKIVDVQQYYADVYSILADSEEEDLLYRISNGQKVFQTEHRANTLCHKIQLPQCAAVLDLGCAKGLVLREVCRRRPDVRPYFFEISDRYVHFWKRMAEPEQWATGRIPDAWRNRFDVVTSFYVLEHVEHPVSTICEQSELLKLGGILYFIVPNVHANTADFVVADHLQHYSENSLSYLLERCGLETVDIDDESHECAFVVVARKTREPKQDYKPKRPIENLKQQVIEMSRFWSDLGDRIREFERLRAQGDRACIYGAGFYGNFIAHCLANHHNIACFVDQNEYVRRKPMQGKPVVAPQDLDPAITKMYVGLNPTRAKEIIRGIPSWNGRHFDCFYV